MPIKNITLWLILFLFGCGNEHSDHVFNDNQPDAGALVSLKSCPTTTDYDDDFLTSHFFEGWQALNQNQSDGCSAAIPYFMDGVDDANVSQLSSLYLEYCKADASEHYSNEQSSPEQVESTLELNLEYVELKWIVELSSCDSKVEQYALGILFLQGHLIPQDMEKALFYLTMSARQEYVNAQQKLIETLYLIGEDQVAEMWLERSQEAINKIDTQTFTHI
ncbi:hypothetical protein CS022_17695 [Veronia nyctiphanis]|uniref:Sel1 repeat family protein n=1 Tax=Veronia nyctiphanis TaxID=1278244 RepID=A0A4Q0YQ25_9GAMM|nr:SEL1-like repeat protein [Veronia nyctiphanis]RXJ72104.1 hypothetical protein CS022_17695 [Veronia nyctiphanis]